MDLLLQSSVHKASKTEMLRYVVGEMDRRDLLKDVCKNMSCAHPSYSPVAIYFNVQAKTYRFLRILLWRVWQERWWKLGEFTTGQSKSKIFLFFKVIHPVLSKVKAKISDLKLLAQFYPYCPGLQSCFSLRTSHTTSATRSKTDC